MVSKIFMEVLDSNKQWLKTPEDVKKFLQKDGMLGNIGFCLPVKSVERFETLSRKGC